ncbi:glucose-6-phosphate isomerase [Candidatus Mycoplasma haematohominis]|uniref:glucose-6-phosphate isomerase n=1 Tax=Candidatus Mycoplasma haematohominis TaxID=1494318 RepID=UPI001C0A73EB|nr:glucose-6-phosphate isomerase [Candidatus Mycoplasma haemohominis]
MSSIKLNIPADQEQKLISDYSEKVQKIFTNLKNKTSPGSEMTGWIEWVNKDHSELINKAEQLRESWIKKGVNYVVLIGTGGSYIGCRAGLEFSRKSYGETGLNFIYVPYFSDRYLSELLDYLKNVKFAVLVISKSGTTLESAISFRLLRELLFSKEGDKYTEYIAAVTDKAKGVLRGVVDKEKLASFVIEDDIGGRYSTLTAVGLVPMILGGIDVRKVLDGAKRAYSENFDGNIGTNKASLYGAYRCSMFNKGLTMECLISYDPHLRYTLETMKQLFAESEGKEEKGLMPVILDFTPDLHSVGQLIQDGKKSFCESTLMVKGSKGDSLKVPKSSFDNDDQLDWVAEKTLKEINNCAFSGTFDAHSNVGKIDNLVIEIDNWEPDMFGYLYYWLSLAAMFSAYLLEVNPFDQPGVETYKKRMFDLLGKK